MSSPQPSQRFLFSDLLTPSEAVHFQNTANWKWVTSIGAPDVEPAIRHRKHQQWIANHAHIHRPGMREIMFCLRGKAVFGYHGKVYRLEPGTLFLFDHHQGRDFVPAPYQKNYATLWLHFDRRDSFRYNTFALDVQGNPHRDLSTRFYEGELSTLMSDAWDQCNAFPFDPLCWTLLKSALATTMLALIGTARRPTVQRNLQAKVVASMQDYIRHHPGDDLNLQNLARMAGYSPFFFHRTFLRYTGLTPRTFVNQVRIERIKELLASQDTLERIAEKIGFQHASYLSRLFKQSTGCTPSQWRARFCQPS